MVDPTIRRMNMQYVALAFFFTLCQVIGTVCTLSDLSVAAGAALFVEERMACPMEGTTICPSSLVSSPKRQIRNSIVVDDDYTRVPLSPAAVLALPSPTTQWSWSNMLSIVPVSIDSSAVLRI